MPDSLGDEDTARSPVSSAKPRSVSERLTVFAKGAAMGAADVVPGVSGGTIAFITGIYEELIESIRAVDLNALSLLARGRLRELWRHVNGDFLLALLLGIVFSVLTLARAITYALEHHPVLVGGFFMGLIAGSAYYILRQIVQWTPGRALLLAAGVAVALAIGEWRPGQLEVTYYWVFLSGAVAICAMILPGISGSFILLLIGMYEPVLGAIRSLQWSLLLTFALGCATGLLSFVRLLSWLLHHHRAALLAFLTGILVGSLSILWPWKLLEDGSLPSAGTALVELHNAWPWQYGNSDVSHWPGALLTLLGGLFIVLGIEKVAED